MASSSGKVVSEQAEITNIGEDRRTPDKVCITVKYGKRPAIEKPSKRMPYPSSYDDRRSTDIYVPKSLAGGFGVGKTVTLRISVDGTAPGKRKKGSGPSRIVEAMVSGRRDR